ncbi:hypothetical protein SAMN05192561_11246 [Halopenitus malekzadehii]|uniref:Uncharacterized protein n=1 Tax=Halopenitus malekzadehii TaxID=1267564 RepID=A0A1H6JNJ6_9EURY|nr:hypothetical protein [Halopenitus malekzadehii]SEH60859.1 hypothetical protein SAMN05192561_11246 [Halopenitus malekzadehii]
MPESEMATVDDTDLVAFHVGDHVQDCDSDDEATLLVAGVPLQRAATYQINEDGKTVADVNPDYAAEEPVVEVIYPQRTDTHLDRKQTYAFPAARLELVAPVHDRDDNTDKERQ